MQQILPFTQTMVQTYVANLRDSTLEDEGRKPICVSHRTPFPTLFSDAEGSEDQVEDVVGGGGAGNFVKRA